MPSKWDPWTPGVLPGARDAPPVQDTPQRGTVLSVTAAGVKFKLDVTPEASYGPAPWSLGVYDTAALALAAGYAPRVGDRVAVLFCGLGLSDPVIAAWWRG